MQMYKINQSQIKKKNKLEEYYASKLKIRSPEQ
jgi:hypothetical protein